MKARLPPWPIPATNEGFGSRMHRQIEFRVDLWWDWCRIQVILKEVTGSVREEGSPFPSPSLVRTGWRGALGVLLMASRPRRMGPPTSLGRRIWMLRLACQLPSTQLWK